MLHIVQVVMWGVAEMPQIFIDEAKARSAYVESARQKWEQRYGAYCEHHGVSADHFESAQAFLNTIDVSEKSTINYWTANPVEMGVGDTKAAGQVGLREFAREVLAMKEGLTRMLDDVSVLVDRCSRTDFLPLAAQSDSRPKVSENSTPAVQQDNPEPDPERLMAPEWKAFVGTVRRLGAGVRNEFYVLPRNDWRQDVYSNRTSLEYWDWVADQIMKHKEKSQSAGYMVVEDPNSPGSYKIVKQGESASEDSFESEWEAWCVAGLQLDASSR